MNKLYKKSLLIKLRNKRFLLSAFIVFLVITAVVTAIGKQINTIPINLYTSSGHNALWLRHQWVGESRTQKEYEKLAEDLKDKRITDAYFHVGPLNGIGKIETEKYPHAMELLAALEVYYPELNVQAWIGQVEKNGGGPLDISNEETVNNIAQTAKAFTDLGFDGIHYNIEPIYSGDENIITLIRETKEVTDGKIVSIASDELEIFPGSEAIIRLFSTQTGFWNREYYRRIADEADQVAVMMYDTALPFSSLFTILVEWQTRNLLKEIGDSAILFVGVPTYEDQRWSFHPRAENMKSGLIGVQKGVGKFAPENLNNFGVAIYGEWTTDEKEWDIYDKLWLGI